jgi:general secretion pathway protein G
VPVDPITETSATWVLIPAPEGAAGKGAAYDVKSGAPGNGSDGSPYAQW